MTDADCTLTPTPLDRVAQLARIADAMERGEVPAADDGQWIASALRCYLADAALGVSMEDAMGLSPSAPGEEHWTTTHRRQRRNAAIRKIRSQPLFADLKISEAAREIAALGCRFRHAGRATKKPAPMAIDLETEDLLTEALITGLPFPGQRQIQSILAT